MPAVLPSEWVHMNFNFVNKTLPQYLQDAMLNIAASYNNTLYMMNNGIFVPTFIAPVSNSSSNEDKETNTKSYGRVSIVCWAMIIGCGVLSF